MEEPTEASWLERTGRCGIVALVGRANVGKSTLLNRILEEKVSIVSPVPQTTRNVVRGIYSEERGQLVFLDTPGIHKPFNELGRRMNASARKAVGGVDLVLFVMDASEPPREEDEGWMRRLIKEGRPVVAALNKSDLGPSRADAYRERWAMFAKEKAAEAPHWIPVSAKEGSGVPDLLRRLFERLPEGPFLFPTDVLTDFPRNLNIADMIREQFFRVLRDEIPHHIAVGVSSVDETGEAMVVKAAVYVNKPTQKGIVLGKKGRRLRQVRETAERELSSMYGRPVKIEKLWVKVEKNWVKNYFLLQQLGYRE